MNAKEITYALKTGTFTSQELSTIVEAIKYARAELARDIKSSIRVGALVQFKSNRTGSVYTGTVERIKIKNVLVNTTQGRFNVPATMLELA
jgi:ribosomal protein L35AE/L33A